MGDDSKRLVVLSEVFRELTDERQDRLLKTAEGLLSAQRAAKEPDAHLQGVKFSAGGRGSVNRTGTQRS